VEGHSYRGKEGQDERTVCDKKYRGAILTSEAALAETHPLPLCGVSRLQTTLSPTRCGPKPLKGLAVTRASTLRMEFKFLKNRKIHFMISSKGRT